MEEGRDPQNVILNRSEVKESLGKMVVARKILIEIRTAYFSIYNLHLNPTLKKSFNIISSVTFLGNLR